MDATIIEREVGRCNTDIALGWECGLRGKCRIWGRLHDRRAPDHFYDQKNVTRLIDWRQGYDAALRYRKNTLCREIYWSAMNADGPVTGKRKGWGISRGQIVNKLEKKGCYGDVIFSYIEGTTILRTVKCGI